MNTAKQSRRASSQRSYLLVAFALAMLLGVSTNTQAQWTTNGNNINNTNTGNVGIGTTTPNTPVHLLTNSVDGLGMKIENSGASSTDKYFTLLQLGSNGYGVSGWANAALMEGTGSGGLVFSGYGGSVKFQTSSSRTTRMMIDASGNVGIGTTAPTTKLHVVGDITVTGNINAKYQDVAEWVPSRQNLAPGTVVILDIEQSNQVTASTQAYDTKVAGVVSAQPGVILGEAGENKEMIATTGRVKVKVDATRSPIKVGDLLVTSEKEGVAMKSEPLMIQGRPFHSPGTLIGKALEPLEKGTGEILVLLSLQ